MSRDTDLNMFSCLVRLKLCCSGICFCQLEQFEFIIIYQIYKDMSLWTWCWCWSCSGWDYVRFWCTWSRSQDRPDGWTDVAPRLVTFVSALLTYSCVQPFISPSVLTGFRFYQKIDAGIDGRQIKPLWQPAVIFQLNWFHFKWSMFVQWSAPPPRVCFTLTPHERDIIHRQESVPASHPNKTQSNEASVGAVISTLLYKGWHNYILPALQKMLTSPGSIKRNLQQQNRRFLGSGAVAHAL